MSEPYPFVLELHPEREKLVQRTIETFQPLSDEPFTEHDARESLDNLCAFFQVLVRHHARGAK